MVSNRRMGSSPSESVSEFVKRVLQASKEGQKVLDLERFKASLGSSKRVVLLSLEEYLDRYMQPFDENEWRSDFPHLSTEEAELIYAHTAVSQYKNYLQSQLTINDPGTLL